MDALVNTHFCGVSVHADVSRGARRHRTPCILLLFASTHNMNMCVSSNSHKYMLTQTVCDEYERPKHDSSIYIFIHHTLLIHHTLDAWDDCLPDLEPITCDADKENMLDVSFHKQSLNQLHYLLTPTHIWIRKWDEMAKQNICDFENGALDTEFNLTIKGCLWQDQTTFFKFAKESVHADVSRGARRHRTPCILLLFATTHNMNMCVSSNSHKYMWIQTVCDEYERPKDDSSIYMSLRV